MRLLLLSVLLLAGCSTAVSKEEWDRAESLCKNNLGVRWALTNSINRLEVACVNGARFDVPGQRR